MWHLPLFGHLFTVMSAFSSRATRDIGHAMACTFSNALRKRHAVRSDVTSNDPFTVYKIVRSAGRTSWTSRRLPVSVIVFFDQNGLFVEHGCANLHLAARICV
jgi:hypothetical protein